MNLAKYGHPLDFLDSGYKQDTFFNKHEFFVAPESVNFGLRFECNRDKTKTVYDTFQYVSVEQTMRTLLMNENYLKMFLEASNRITTEGIIEHFADGELAANNSHSSCADSEKLYVQI